MPWKEVVRVRRDAIIVSERSAERALSQNELTVGSGVWPFVRRDVGHLLWPNWATWALIAVVITSLLTIAATINDIW